jgi:hypothetical protein
MDRNEIAHDPRHLGVPSGVSKTISEPIVCLAQIVHLSCTGTNTVSKRHLVVPSGASKMISEPMVCSAQTMHLSYAKISTISKRTKSSFHLSLVTKEYHQVCPKRFLSLRIVLRKSCTYLAPSPTLSPNGLK